MKKTYQQPTLELDFFQTFDVITASGDDDKELFNGDWLD